MITPLWQMISQRGWRGLPGNQSQKMLTFQSSPSVCLYSTGGLFFVSWLIMTNSLRAPFVTCTCIYIPLRRMHSQGHERRGLFGLSSIGKRWNFWRLVQIFWNYLTYLFSNWRNFLPLAQLDPVQVAEQCKSPDLAVVSNLRQRHATWSELCSFSFGPMSRIFVMPNSNPKNWGTVHLEGTRESLWLHEPLTKHRAHGSHFPCSMHDTKRRILWTEQGSLCYRTGFLKCLWTSFNGLFLWKGFWKYLPTLFIIKQWVVWFCNQVNMFFIKLSKLVPADVEKMLFQSFPVHQLDLKPLSRRDPCMHSFFFHNFFWVPFHMWHHLPTCKPRSWKTWQATAWTSEPVQLPGCASSPRWTCRNGIKQGSQPTPRIHCSMIPTEIGCWQKILAAAWRLGTSQFRLSSRVDFC